MAHLEQYVVETPCGEVFRVFAANAFDAGRQVMIKINLNNSLISQKSIVSHSKFNAPE